MVALIAGRGIFVQAEVGERAIYTVPVTHRAANKHIPNIGGKVKEIFPVFADCRKSLGGQELGFDLYREVSRGCAVLFKESVS